MTAKLLLINQIKSVEFQALMLTFFRVYFTHFYSLAHIYTYLCEFTKIITNIENISQFSLSRLVASATQIINDLSVVSVVNEFSRFFVPAARYWALVSYAFTPQCYLGQCDCPRRRLYAISASKKVICARCCKIVSTLRIYI